MPFDGINSYDDPIDLIISDLVNARALITRRRNWTKLKMEKQRTNVFWGMVTAHCSLGALHHIDANHTSIAYLERQCFIRGYTSIASFNDAFTTTHRAVLNAFDDAIACAMKIKQVTAIYADN